MKYIDQPKVYARLLREVQKGGCNAFFDDLKGTAILIKTIRAGQPRPYADSVYESLILCFSPNVWTTNGPSPRRIDEAEARSLARSHVRDWGEHEKPYLGGYLDFIRPEEDPLGLDDKFDKASGKSCCWRVRVVMPFTD